MQPYQFSVVLCAYKNLQKLSHKYLSTIVLATFLIAVPQRGYAVDWVPISGQIQFEGTPLCALVLANGQHMFSCSGNGTYNLTVPLDSNGTITLYAFASGFSPFKQVLTAGEAAVYYVSMVRSDTDRVLDITQTISPGSRANWVNISGTVQSGGLPVCAMALANGQQIFTCGNNLGRFSMSVPLDAKGEITLYNFAAGFSPSKMSMSGGSGVTGQWVGTSTSSIYPCAGNLNVSLQQTGSALSGTLEFHNPNAGTLCVPHVIDKITGDITGNRITIGFTNYLGYIFNGTVSGSTMSGTWTWPYTGDYGSWRLVRQ